MGRLGLLIFHSGTNFGAKMLIDAEIITENRLSVILGLLYRHTGPPTKSFHCATSAFKFYANSMHIFEDMAIGFFLQIWLEMPTHAPEISVFGV